MTPQPPPLVSVIVEGYNAPRNEGSFVTFLDTLKQQLFPLNHVEVIIVGTAQQIQELQDMELGLTDFHRVKMVVSEQEHYYKMKNLGASEASGEILAFSDSDTWLMPQWLDSLVSRINQGADVTVGITLFRSHRGLEPHTARMRSVASITFGWIIGKRSATETFPAVGWQSNNVAFRTDVFHQYYYETEYGRTLSPSLLYRKMTDDGRKIVLEPQQQVLHVFSLYWWHRVHFRYGYEIYWLRRLDPNYPNQWIRRTTIFEPIVTMLWHMLLDSRRWFRFGQVMGIHNLQIWTQFPLMVVMSAFAHSMECCGMYATIIAPERMKQWSSYF